MAGLALAILGMLGATVQAVEIQGTVDVETELLPAFGAEMGLGVVASGDAWSLSSDTVIDLAPAFGGDESLTLTYDLDNLGFAASVYMTLVPFTFDRAETSASMQILDFTLGEEAVVEITSELTVGATLTTTVDPFAKIWTRYGFGDHWLSNTTTFEFAPLDVASTMLAYLSIGEVTVADGLSVKAYGYVELDLVPFGFSYAQLSAKVSVDSVTILNSVTYTGGSSFTVRSTVTLDVEPITVKIWGSYSSSGSDPFAAGASASFSWGPL